MAMLQEPLRKPSSVNSTIMSQSDKQGEASTQRLPPGMVIGPDGKPCKICTAMRHWTRTTDGTGQRAGGETSNKKGTPSSQANVMAAMAGLGAAVHPDVPPEGCPPDVEQLGRATWTFLHTTAAYYPEKPTAAQQSHMLGLLSALPSLYPCSWCASHLGENIKVHPPVVSGRVALSRWLCERHNDVNERLGKPRFDCSIEKTDERWKDGPSDGRCD